MADCAERDGLAALLYAAVARSEGRLHPAPPTEVVQRLRLEIASMTLAVTMRARAERCRLPDLFADQGIPVILVKGSALAASVYRNPAHRAMCDLDLAAHLVVHHRVPGAALGIRHRSVAHSLCGADGLAAGDAGCHRVRAGVDTARGA